MVSDRARPGPRANARYRRVGAPRRPGAVLAPRGAVV